jgi:hypothetical protein
VVRRLLHQHHWDLLPLLPLLRLMRCQQQGP